MTPGGHLGVFSGGRRMGRLWVAEGGSYAFRYEPAWINAQDAFPLSISLPLAAEEYQGDNVKSFFDNLLPEGDVRAVLARRLKVSESNVYALLVEVGGDCAGALSLLPPDVEGSPGRGWYESLDEAGLAQIIKTLPQRPLLAGEGRVRLSLAGAQNKLPVYVQNGEVALPKDGAPSSHILKPAITSQGIWESVANEAFCLRLASRAGLATPACSLLRPKGQEALLVARYDRAIEEDGCLVRLHQEDFCQALGYSPGTKYQAEGGPGLEDCFGLVRGHSARALRDAADLLRWTILNILVGNMDAHAKNLSLLHLPEGPKLAPFYDLLSTDLYPNLSRRLAMKIGGENRIDWIMRRHWERFAQAVGIKGDAVMSEVRALAARLPDQAKDTAEELKELGCATEFLGSLVDAVAERTRTVLAHLEQGPGADHGEAESPR